MTAPPAGPIPWQGAEFPPRQWQAEALPIVVAALKRRERGIVSATMGAGKSVLQAELCYVKLPSLGEDAIVLTAPRKRLVKQLSATVAKRCGARNVGMYYSDKKQVDRRIIVCCNNSLPALTLELAARRRRVALLIVDEAHTSEADTVRDTIPLLDPVCLVGFTATPCRSVPTQTLSLFDRVLVRYTMRQAVAAGDLVDFRHIRILGEELPGPIDEVCLDMMREHCDGFGPGLVSASNIADAEAYAAWLTERGWAALPIHSKLSERQQDANLARLWAGDVRCLVHPALLAEGVDFPALRWLCHRRKVQAGVRFWQETGRPTRADNNPDPRLGPKTHAIILDPHLLLGRHGPMTLEALGQAIEDATDVEEAHPSVERARRTLTEAEAVALDLLLLYLDDIHGRLVRAGIVKEPEYRPGRWQYEPVTQATVEMIRGVSALTKHVPGQCRPPIRALVQVPWALKQGEAEKLVGVLLGGRRYAVPIMRKTRKYASQVQWNARLVDSPAPDHETILAAGRGGRKMEPE